MKTLFLSTLVIFTLLACKTKKGTTQTATLTNSSWQVVLLEEKAPKSTQTLSFSGDAVKGKGACNGYGGKVMLNDQNTITISEVFSTKMACPELSEENSFFQSLKNTTSYKLDKNELTFYDLDKKMLVKFIKI